MKTQKVFLILVFILVATVVNAGTEYLTLKVKGMELFINYSNGTEELIKLKAEEVGKKGGNLELPALSKMEKLSEEGWELVDVEELNDGIRYNLYVMKRVKK